MFVSVSLNVHFLNLFEEILESKNVAIIYYAISKLWFLSALVLGEEQPTSEVNNPSTRHPKKTGANLILPKPSGALDKIMTKNSKVSCLISQIEQR